jgi:hypothetical protein
MNLPVNGLNFMSTVGGIPGLLCKWMTSNVQHGFQSFNVDLGLNSHPKKLILLLLRLIEGGRIFEEIRQ